MNPRSPRALLVLLCLLTSAVSLAQQPVVPAGSRFVMSHFKSNTGGGDERLYVSVSPDALQWTALNGGNPVWQPANWSPFNNVVRDPSILFANGFYWVAFTSGNYGRHASFGLVKSTDLVTWTFVGEISTPLPGATDPLTWNPAFFRDGDGSVHLFISIGPIGGTDYNPVPTVRTHEMHPLNADFTAWSAPVQVALPDSNTNEFWAWREGETYHAIYVAYADNGAQIHVTAANLLGPWSNRRRLGFDSQEGGNVLKKPGGGYRLYLERGNTGNPQSTYRWCDVDSAFTTFTPFQFVQSDTPMRNGKMTALAAVTTFSQWQSARLLGVPSADRGPLADPDADGFVNLLECALDLPPRIPTRSGGPVAAAGPALGLAWRRVPSLSGVSYQAESAGSLGGAFTPVPTLSAVLMTDGTEEVQSREAGASGAQRFIRLRVSQP